MLNTPVTDAYRLLSAKLSEIVHETTEPIYQASALEQPTVSEAVTGIWLDRLCWRVGVRSVFEVLEMAKSARLGELIGKLECPTLCLISEAGESELAKEENEYAEQNEQTREFYNALNSPKQMRVFTADEGAEAFCQVNNLGLMHATVFDWLDEL